MSKCDIQIVLDNPSRQFETGDTVSGTILIQVNTNVNCRKLVLSGLWRTHGRGNTKQTEYFNTILTSGEWKAGESYKFSFSYQIPDYPVTYRGNYLNIDHYIKVNVDVPWAWDPKAELDYVVAPAASNRYADSLQLEMPNESSVGFWIGLVIGGAMVLGGILFSIVSFGLTMIGSLIGCIILFYTYRKTLAERVLGKVEVDGLPNFAEAGKSLPFSFSFVPKSETALNKMQISLTGSEVVVSGSGTKKTTHRHKFHDEYVPLVYPSKVTAGQPVTVRGMIHIPQTFAYSVSIPENKIVWQTMVHIDIPRWPDWVSYYDLKVIPSSTEMANPENAPDAIEIPPEKMPMAGNIENDHYSGPIQNDPMPTIDHELVAIVGKLKSADRFSDEAHSILETNSSHIFEVRMFVDRVNPSVDFGDDPKYSTGYTIQGTLQGTDHDVMIQMPNDYNDMIKDLSHGDIWCGKGAIIKWDALYGKLEMLGW